MAVASKPFDLGEFHDVVGRNVCTMIGVPVTELRRFVLSNFTESALRAARVTKVSPAQWQVRTSPGNHEIDRAEGPLFEELRLKFDRLLSGYPNVSLRACALIGYNVSGRSTMHTDMATGIRLVLHLGGIFPNISPKTITFFGPGGSRGEFKRKFDLDHDHCYFATERARGVLGEGLPKTVRGGRLSHQACGGAHGVSLVLDFNVDVDGESEEFKMHVLKNVLEDIEYPPCTDDAISLPVLVRILGRKAMLWEAGAQRHHWPWPVEGKELEDRDEEWRAAWLQEPLAWGRTSKRRRFERKRSARKRQKLDKEAAKAAKAQAKSDKEAAGPTRQRSSQYRGVTKHRSSGKWDAKIWVRETAKEVYLGRYELEEHAAEAYDVAALKIKGHKVKTNFETSKYSELLQNMDTKTLDELVMAVRRQSQGFARGSSKFRGVRRHNGRWEANICMPGSKQIYLGLHNDEAEAAASYDKALVKLKGPAAATNFALSEYHEELKEYHKAQQGVRPGPRSGRGTRRSFLGAVG